MINIVAIKPIASAISKELFHSLIIFFILSAFIFFLVYNAPGDEIAHHYLSSVTAHEIEETISPMHLYLLWLSSSLSGNFGTSVANGLPVFDQVVNSLTHTVSLILQALLIAIPLVLINISMSFSDSLNRFSKTLSLALNILSVFPVFWLSYLSIYLTSTYFGILPVGEATDSSSFFHSLLPVVLLSIGSGILIHMTQHTKSELLRVLNEEYVLYAKAKGAKISKHILKEGIIYPLLNLMSNQVAYLFSACIIIEQIFNRPGIGRVLWQATQDRDIPLLLGAVIATAFIIRLVQFFAKVIYIILNPRASHQ